MAESFRGADFRHPSPAPGRPHVFGFNTIRFMVTPLFEVRNGSESGDTVFAVTRIAFTANQLQASEVQVFDFDTPLSRLGGRLRVYFESLSLPDGLDERMANVGVYRSVVSAGTTILTGYSSPASGQVAYISLRGGALTIAHEHTASNPEFRFHTSTGADVILLGQQIYRLIYDESISRWRLFAGGVTLS